MCDCASDIICSQTVTGLGMTIRHQLAEAKIGYLNCKTPPANLQAQSDLVQFTTALLSLSHKHAN